MSNDEYRGDVELTAEEVNVGLVGAYEQGIVGAELPADFAQQNTVRYNAMQKAHRLGELYRAMMLYPVTANWGWRDYAADWWAVHYATAAMLAEDIVRLVRRNTNRR